MAAPPRAMVRETIGVRIFITGGSGFIGSYFHDLLTTAGHELVIYDLVQPPFALKNATFIRGDVRDGEKLKRSMAGCDRVLALAAAHHDFGIDHDTYFAVNERGTQLICDAMDTHGIRDLCFYSSCAVFGDSKPPLREDSPTAPNSPYGASKLAGEKVIKPWADQGANRRALIIRPTITFGPRNFANMYSLIRQIHNKRYLQIGRGSNIKSLSYVENIVSATNFLWMRPESDRAPFDIYNYIDKPDLNSRQIAEAVYAALGRKFPSFSIPMGLGLLLALPFDIVIKLTGKNLPVSSARVKKLAGTETKFEADKLTAAGFTPPIPLTEGIARMVRWYLDEGRTKEAVWHLPPAQPVIVAD
ncbi:MAG: NAD(P)-dependent oxidoreductase [Phycisphaeraceae bacterium]|nr:MAG: NAD(P)-dependent oxidoreductase [Phycisphaeraceae bacterium]